MGGDGRGSEEREGGARGDEISGVSPLETVSHPGRLHKVPAASRGGGGRTRTRTEGQKSKMKPRQSTSILTPTDGRTDGRTTAHMSGSGSTRQREERGEATCRQGGGSFVVRGAEERGVKVAYGIDETESLGCLLSFARFPPKEEVDMRTSH